MPLSSWSPLPAASEAALAPTHIWIQQRATRWTERIALLSAAGIHHPQSTHIAMQRSLKLEWQHLQRTTPCDPKVFQPIEEALAQVFLPALFQLPHADPV